MPKTSYPDSYAGIFWWWYETEKCTRLTWRPALNNKCPFVWAFWAQKACFAKSWSNLCVWFSPKRNFLKKVAFWAKANNSLRMRKPYGAEEVHKTKSPMRVCNYPFALPSITKLPLINVLSFHAWSSLSRLSSQT